MLTVEYELTKGDMLRFWRHHALTASYLRAFAVCAVLFTALANGVITYLRWSSHPGQLRATLWSVVSTVLVFVLVAAILGPILLWALIHFLLREGKNRGMLGRHRVVLDDEVLREETDYGEQVVRWGAVHRVEQTSSYVFIYLQAAMAHVVPKRAFASEVDSAAFFARAQALWQRASSKGAGSG